jgi:arylsulfate sulfotransferase
MRKAVQICAVLALVGATTGLSKASFSVQLTPSISSGAPVGSSVMWTATTSGTTGKPNYRFSVTSAGTTRIIRDFSVVNTLPWTELTEGSYTVIVYVQSGGVQVQTSIPFIFTSRITAGTPVVSSTVHPLVALYSAPVCSAGTVLVQFWPVAGGEQTMATSPLACNGSTSLNFEVAGMLPNSAYILQQVTTVNGTPTLGPQLNFQTGAINYPIPTFEPVTPPNGSTSTAENVMLTSFKTTGASPTPYPPVATDLYGKVLWYYWDPESPVTPPNGYVTRPVAGGTILMLLSSKNTIREFDLLGNIVHESTASRLSAQLTAMGTDPVGWLSHEALRLPNGHTVTLGSAERLYTNVQGPGTVDVVDDVIIDMDQNFQVTWYWNAFDFLNVAYPAVLGEKCGVGGRDHCGNLRLAATAPTAI